MLFDQYWFRTWYGTIVIDTFVIPYLLFGPNRNHFPWVGFAISIPIAIFSTDILVPILKDQNRCFVNLDGIFRNGSILPIVIVDGIGSGFVVVVRALFCIARSVVLGLVFRISVHTITRLIGSSSSSSRNSNSSGSEGIIHIGFLPGGDTPIELMYGIGL
jgi:hypothetical protein